jgi:hypothetical protein
MNPAAPVMTIRWLMSLMISGGEAWNLVIS